MRAALVIARRDFRSAYETPLAYVLNAAFLAVSGVLFIFYLSTFSDLSAQVQSNPVLAGAKGALEFDARVVGPMLQALVLLLVMLVPVLTMRLLAEERSRGTMELLVTAPISSATLVAGKFLAGFALALVPIVLTVWYPLALVVVATPDPKPLLAGYLGLALIAAAFTSVGLLASALTDSPALAAFLAFTGLLLSALAGVVAEGMDTTWGHGLASLSLLTHYGRLSSGILDTGDVAHLVLFTLALLFLTERVVESRRWR